MAQQSEQVPDWARSLDKWGKRFWRPTDAERRQARRAGYVGAIVVNVLLVIITHNVGSWGVSFITPAFVDVFWAIDLSLGATIFANVMFLAYDARWFRRLTQIVLNGCAFVAAATLYGVFPFDFGEPFWNDAVRISLFAVMLALVIAIIVEVIVFFVGEVGRHALD